MVAAPPRWSASCRLPISGVSVEVFRLAQLTVWLWWPTIALPIGTSRLLAADGMVITTTVDCTGHRVSRAVPHGPRLTCNAIPVVSRPFTGWVAGESDPPLASFALTSLSFQLPAGH